VREDDGAEHVIVAMHRVYPVQQWNREPGLLRALLEAIVKVGPGLETVAFLGIGIAAAQHGAEKVALDVRRIFDGRLFGLGHLADLLVERHAG
jgi:hypothetical protein